MRAAREKVRVAHALAEFPLLAAAMARGELSYSKVRAITRIVTPATEADLLAIALAGTSNHVERIVSAYRRGERVAEDGEDRAFQERSLYAHTAGDTIEITVRVPVEAGKALMAAIERFVTADLMSRCQPGVPTPWSSWPNMRSPTPTRPPLATSGIW